MRTLLAWLWKLLWRQPDAPVVVAVAPPPQPDIPDSSPVCPVLSTEEPTPPAPPPLVMVPPPAPRAPRRRITKTLAEILENVEECFQVANMPLGECITQINRDTRRALNKMGPWVPYASPWKDENSLNIDWKKWPALLYMSRGFPSARVDGFIDKAGGQFGYIMGAYAIKLDKPPWDVHSSVRPVYEFGLAFRFKGQIEWAISHIGVDKEAKRFVVCEELMLTRVPIKKVGSYFRKEWIRPVTDTSTAWGETKAIREAVLVELFENVLGWWCKRGDRWTVSVRKEKRRVTFSVEQQNTKHFFKDRDKTIVARDGKRKRIIHHVNEHTRTYADGHETTVKEHIRGLRRFSWRGYECAVTAPQFHVWTLQGFDVGAYDEDDVPNRNGMPMSAVAKMLARGEDDQVMKLKERKAI